MTFDAICHEKWQDIVEEVLQKYQDVELDRTVDAERKKMVSDTWALTQGVNTSVHIIVYEKRHVFWAKKKRSFLKKKKFVLKKRYLKMKWLL